VSNISIKNEALGSTAATAIAVTKNTHPPVGRKFEQQVNISYKASIETFFPKKKKKKMGTPGSHSLLHVDNVDGSFDFSQVDQ
jgi:hypothetical protein